MPFEPIAIVGRACVLPDALDPDAFWANVASGRVSVSAAPQDRWRLSRAQVMGTRADSTDRTWSDAGGYVHGFESVFDPSGFDLAADAVRGLDLVSRWVLHTAREALRDAGQPLPASRSGLIMGNLSFPSAAMAEFAEHVWLERQLPEVRQALGPLLSRVASDPRSRFSSGLPAHVAARALGLGAGAFALDAACASSLYAIKLACDKLHDGAADLMLAGAVNCPDDLFIHVGFCALEAMSSSGRSRPFHRDADGLVPAEGAALVALMRLRDAVAQGRDIHGVIRGIGLSNDGRSGGLLVPAQEGQERAMRQAYEMAGLAPESVSLIECHATGTVVGDSVEARSMGRVFGGAPDVPIGSAKSNVGHLITAAGAAGLVKVLGAMRAGVRPPTLGAEHPIDALAGTPLRLLRETEEWQGQRRAAVSAFGFGGNNAHLIVDAWDSTTAAVSEPMPSLSEDQVAIVALGARVADGRDAGEFADALFRGVPRRAARAAIDVALRELRFPPVDLEHTHAQQLLVLEAAREAVRGIALPRERTAVLIGMGCDPEVARYGARWRSSSWLDQLDITDPLLHSDFRDGFGPALTSAGVLGTMPNVVANRINAQLDLTGPGFTVSAEEASGPVALELAARALRAGEIDAAVVGAVDLSHEPVHQAAMDSLGESRPPGDAAVVLVLKRLAEARRDGDTVMALLDKTSAGAADLVVGEHGFDPAELFGHAHAAKGLLAVASAVLAVHHRAVPQVNGPAEPALGAQVAEAVVRPLDAPAVRVRLRGGDTPAAWVAQAPPRPHVYSGTDRRTVLAALASGRESDEGPARLVILAADAEQLLERSAAARTWLTTDGVQPDGVAFRESPIGGELAFVFAGGSMAYHGMGRELMLAFPSALQAIEDRCGPLREIAGWAYAKDEVGSRPVLEQIWGSSLLGQLHAEITRGVLGIAPNAVLGYSSGESAALSAMGVWTDTAALVRDARGIELFTTELVGDIAAVRRVWEREGITGDRWVSYLVNASADEVRSALREERAVHLMVVNAPDSCVIGGEAGGCERVLNRLGSCVAIPVDYEIAVHAPEVAEVRDTWWNLHHRPTAELPGVRFYTGATTDWYHPTSETAADALTGQALGTIDFAAIVERAWQDGVRVFIEHGPRALCTKWIQSTLGDREHLAVALDAADGRNLRQLSRVAAELMAAGVSLAADELFDRLAAAAPRGREDGDHVTVPAHPKAVRLPELAEPAEIMVPAPALPAAPGTAVAAVAFAPVSPAPPAESAVQTGTTARRDHVTKAHQDFLIIQAQVHQHFLASRQRALQTLSLRRSGAPVAPIEAPQARVEPPAPVHAPAGLPGPKFDRAQLEHLAGNKISDVFGPLFEPQDGYARQTRMPMPPMLLADRVTGIDAVPGSMGTGTIWTETDVAHDSWYLDPTGRMPAGVMIEAGQADLLLISWLGADLLNQGERVYRLLGCDLTFHGGPPVAGDTLSFAIDIDGHGEHDGKRLFFFHYDCHIGDSLRLSVRNGQAGFFTDAELAATSGVLWDPAADLPAEGTPVDPPAVPCQENRFGQAEVRAFADGRAADCFGPGWERARSHVRSPRIADDRMLFLHEVTEFDPAGGPWGRGYLRAEAEVSPDDWFFEGHFANDPCMPGTLMFEGCLQAMSFYLAAMGFTIERDGWRFEPVPGQTYPLRCRGQVTPDSRRLAYEVFVAEVTSGPEPILVADVLVTVDGVKAFHARRVGLRLVPDWPMTHWRELGPHAEQTTGEMVPPSTLGGLVDHRDSGEVAVVDGFRFDYASLLACAWGRPSEAFGAPYAVFDGTRKVARLPGPPYHFMSRVAAVDGPQGGMRIGSWVEVDYDVPDEVWYWEQNGYPTMPFGVLMEVALQPCGWLASYVGSALTTDTDLLFRNLDGTGNLTGEIKPGTRTIRTRATLTQVSQNADIIIEAFTVECFADGTSVFELTTVFGYFPKTAFDNQVGLPPSDEEKAALLEPGSGVVDLVARPERYCGGSLRLPGPMLLMLDRVTGYWPDGGRAGLGRLRAEKEVDPGEWFFKAHFFQDPVQPGSLGIEAMCQLLQFYLIERDSGAGMIRPRFEPVMVGEGVTWKYRGQVVPTNGRITVEMEILETGEDAQGRYAVAEAWLWADGKRIYHAPRLGMRVVPGDPDGTTPAFVEHVIDPANDDWLLDHRPTWTVPALPMMSVADKLAAALEDTSDLPVVELRDVRLQRWVPVRQRVRVATELAQSGNGWDASLLVWRDAATPELSRFESVASCQVHVGVPGGPRPEAFEPLPDAEPVDDPYASGALFHGPSFQYLTALRVGPAGSSGVLDAGRGCVPRGALHQGLLDAATHVIPHDSLSRWSGEISRTVVGYPTRIPSLRLFEPLPDRGKVAVEARFAGFDGGDLRYPMFDLQLSACGRVLAAMRLVDTLVPKGSVGAARTEARRAFLRDMVYADGLGLAVSDGDVTRLTAQDVDLCDWLPGTVAAVYGLPPGARGRDHLVPIAVRDHVARLLRVHPSLLTVEADGDLWIAYPAGSPSGRLLVWTERADDEVIVRSAGFPELTRSPVIEPSRRPE